MGVGVGGCRSPGRTLKKREEVSVNPSPLESPDVTEQATTEKLLSHHTSSEDPYILALYQSSVHGKIVGGNGFISGCQFSFKQ